MYTLEIARVFQVYSVNNLIFSIKLILDGMRDLEYANKCKALFLKINIKRNH